MAKDKENSNYKVIAENRRARFDYAIEEDLECGILLEGSEVKSLRQGAKGVCILAGDVSPVDVIAHLPVLCEEQDVPYIYVPSKQDLGYAALTKRPTSVVLVAPKGGAAFEHQDLLDKAISAVGSK